MHFPPFWRFRLLRAIHASGWKGNRRLLRAWAKAEGGKAHWNPLNTTEPWKGATDYNSAGVKNYRWPRDGIAATAATLQNGFYPGIVRDLRLGKFTAKEIVERNAAEFDKWGTGSKLILEVLAGMK